jgi:hypothetical protein
MTSYSRSVAESLAFKANLEAEFENSTGIQGRQYYSSAYSLPQRSPVMWINLNPGGTSDSYRILSDADLATGKHEFFDGHGGTSKATGRFLRLVFDAPMERLRAVQGTNLAWERSRSAGDIDVEAAAIKPCPTSSAILSSPNQAFSSLVAFLLSTRSFVCTVRRFLAPRWSVKNLGAYGLLACFFVR